jgi:hypothetical protein
LSLSSPIEWKIFSLYKAFILTKGLLPVNGKCVPFAYFRKPSGYPGNDSTQKENSSPLTKAQVTDFTGLNVFLFLWLLAFNMLSSVLEP